MSIIHFGIKMKKPEEELRLTRENYIQYHDDGSPIFSFGPMDDERLKNHIHRCMTNFDLNMKFFKSLDREEFSEHMNSYLSTHPSFVEAKDLWEWNRVPAVYLLVLGEYKQVYLGTTKNLKQRVHYHWLHKKEIDRLIFGGVTGSRLSIDSFRALDTTMIYASPTAEENKFINEERAMTLDNRFRLNRTATGLLEGGLKEAIENRETRNLHGIDF